MQTKIKNLEKKIAQLRDDTKGEVKDSYKEAAQTQLMIETYEKQLTTLKQDQDSEIIRTVTLKSPDGGIKEFVISTSNPDPAKGILSEKSPIGKKLLKANSGDKITIGETIYIVEDTEWNINWEYI